MLERAVAWAWNRFRPREGWLPLWLLVGIVATLVLAVREVGWVPEDRVVSLTAFSGLLMGVVLAKRPERGWFAWLMIILYGLLLNFVHLAELWPPLSILNQGWESIRQHWLQNGALFLDRMAGWFTAALNEGYSRETIVFASGLGIAAWLLCAYLGWSTFRQHRPLFGITLLGVAIAMNGYYGEAQIWWAAAFVAMAALTAAVIHFANLEQQWQTAQVDFSDQIRLDLTLAGTAIAMVLLGLALLLPTFRISAITRFLLDNSAVEQTEQTLEQVFAGVKQPRRGGLGASVEGHASGAAMPRTFLLGNAPELYETVVMTARVSWIDETGQEVAAPVEFLRRAHWRGLSYDVYASGGWALSPTRLESITADNFIPQPPVPTQVRLSQSVTWRLGQSTRRYTVGIPLRFDQDVSTYWRGASDLSWVQGAGNQYQALSYLNGATAEELRQAKLADVPPALMARYTDLPPTVPVRVYELAQEIAGGLSNPYDQARALERFLRQYEYSLDVELPPPGVDPVDYFLFELQRGYCDYYATAMIVMARSLGLPARLGVGFLPQPSNENGEQVIYQINGHSWSEIYFAGYGWVEFEPTAGFRSPHELPIDVADTGRPDFIGELGTENLPLPLAIPEPEPMRPFPWQRVIIGILIALGLGVWWRRRVRSQELEGVFWAYARLQQQARQLGYPPPPSQTPSEFTRAFLGHLRDLARSPSLAERLGKMRPQIERLNDLFIQRQYSPRKEAGAAAALESWFNLKRDFRRLRLAQWLAGWRKSVEKPPIE
jgi:hypothetical protein